MKVTDYTVIDGVKREYIINAVRVYIANGWTPLGGICSNNGLYQAMVKYSEEPKEEIKELE